MGKSEEREVLCEDLAGQGCGLKKVIDVIGGKWKIMILCVIDKEETVRYGELRRSVFGITNTIQFFLRCNTQKRIRPVDFQMCK